MSAPKIGVDAYGEPTYANETITPQLAAKYHEMYIRNRPLRKAKIEQYTNAMSGVKGQWWLTGETIIFDWNGVPINGDHRFVSCMNSGVAFRTAVARGVNPEAFKAIDSTASRGFKDDLAIEGVRNSSAAGGLLRKIACWTHNQELDAEARGVLPEDGRGGLAGLGSFSVSRVELHEMWPVYGPEILATIEDTRKYFDSWPGDRGAMMFVYWLLTKQGNSHDTIDKYFTILTFGTEDKDKHNVLLRLRDVLAGKMTAERAEKMKNHKQEYHTYWMLQNWTRWINMSRLPSFNLRGQGGTVANPFPVAKRAR